MRPYNKFIIMESTNNLHHLQDQPQAAVESSSLSTPSCYAVGPTSTHSWTPSTITLNAGNNFNPNLQEANPRSRSSTHNKNNIGVPPRPLNDSMIQDLGYHLTSSNHSSSHHHLDSQFSVGFPKFSEMLINSAPSSMEGYNRLPPTSTTTQMKINNNEHKDMNSLMLKTLFSGDHFYSTSAQNYPNFGGTSVPISRENFSQIYPTINISNLNQNQNQNQNQSSACTALDLSMPSLDLDLLTPPPPTSFSAGLSHHSQHHHGDNLSFSLHHMQHPTDRSSCSNSTNPSLFTNGTAETKRPACTLMESKASQSQTALKKSRSSESRPSCPPIKVRKEKLGDRIAALQQLVAPFGKTDTASVLMEAIGYIKFLQGQVETLSVPYMKPSQNQTNRVMQGGSVTDGEPKQDLRSRGLCLVPLSCMSYIAGDGGSEVWQQRPNFGGPT